MSGHGPRVSSGSVPTLQCLHLPPAHTTRWGRARVQWHPHLKYNRCQAPINKQSMSSYACLFDKDCISTSSHAVFVFSLSTNSESGGSKSGTASSCHRTPVLETAHLALLLVQPAGSLEAEAPLSPNTVLWRISLCQVGWGQLLSTSDPNQQDLQPKGITPSLLHPWPATTNAEEGAPTQSTLSLPRSKAPALCSQFGWGAIVYAPDLLGYTN